MKLFKRRAKPDSGTPAASPTEAIDGASTDEVEPGQMPTLPVSTRQSSPVSNKQAILNPWQRLRGCSGAFGMG